MVTDEAAARGERDLVGVLTIEGGTEMLSSAREFVRTRAVPPMGGERLDDLVLVANELVTNALQHGGDGEIRLTIRVDDGGVEMSVASPGDGHATFPTGRAPIRFLDGRGLQIVAALSDEATIVRDGDHVRVVCRFAA